MLYSAIVGFVAYYLVRFVIGIFVNAMAFEGEFITLAVIGFICAYYVRNYSQFVYRMSMGVGLIASIFLVAIEVVLPMIANSGNKWITTIAIIAGVVIYLATRRRIYQHYTRHNPDGTLAAPPFGREWCRWLFIVTM